MTDFAELGIHVNPHGGEEQRVPCPRCGKGSHDRAMGVNITTGRFHCFRCGWKTSDEPGAVATSSTVYRIDDPALAERKREKLRRIWRETVALDHPDAQPVRAYLEARALGEILNSPPVALRAHRGIPYWDRGKIFGTYPAMVALIHGKDGHPVTLHVTFLRNDGCAKASVQSPKKVLQVPVKGATKGGAIRLYEPRDGVLGIAEGIESALSMYVLRRIPVWSSYCADNLVRAQLPVGLRELYIGVDLDASGKGEEVAEALAKRVCRVNPHPKIYIMTPEVDGTGDLNDELRRRKYGH